MADKLTPTDRMRLDKWLWAARFYKTRSLATEEVGKGRVTVNGQECKPARDIKVGDHIALRRQDLSITIKVLGLSPGRGSAPVAQKLYEETPDSLQARQQAAEQRRLAPEPAHSIADGRPTKRDRRALQDHRDVAAHAWDDRWSASLPD